MIVKKKVWNTPVIGAVWLCLGSFFSSVRCEQQEVPFGMPECGLEWIIFQTRSVANLNVHPTRYT